jgi:hypothetical protein
LKEELTKLDSAKVIPVELDGGTPELELELKMMLVSVECIAELEKMKLDSGEVLDTG